MSRRENKFIKESGASSSEETSTTFNSYFATRTSSLTQSSPPAMETSGVEAGIYTRLPVFEKTLTRSLRLSPSETTPIVSSDQPRNNEQQVNERVEAGGTNCCFAAINCYANSIIKFRNSAFIYIVQLLFSLIPVSAIVMGVLFAENCPKVHFLPVFGAVVGVIGAIFMAIWMFVSCSYRLGTPCSNRQTFLFGMLCFVLLVMIIVDAVFVICLSPSFDSSSTEYCNETFYTYAFYKEVATAVVIFLSAMLYLPGSRHILCCHDCSMRSTPNAFYVSL